VCVCELVRVCVCVCVCGACMVSRVYNDINDHALLMAYIYLCGREGVPYVSGRVYSVWGRVYSVWGEGV